MSFEESIKIPLLVKEPRQQKGNVVTQPVSQIDLVPTLLENLGKTVQSPLHGKVLPRFDGDGDSLPVIIDWNQQTGLENDPWVNRCVEAVGGIADADRVREVWSDRIRTIIRPDGWKFSWSEKGWDELFNLDQDPLEFKNLVESDHTSDLILESKRMIQEWQKDTGDPDAGLFHNF